METICQKELRGRSENDISEQACDGNKAVLTRRGREEDNRILSVVMPVYHAEKYLPEALDSLLRQTFQDYEVICIDDGSDDMSLSILLDYAGKDPRISVYTQTHAGCSAARNVGLQAAGGEYIYFMDSDDLLEPHALETILSAARKNRLDMLCFNAEVFIDPGFVPKNRPFRKNYQRKSEYPVCAKGDEMYVAFSEKGEYYATLWSMLFRTDFLRSHQICFYPGIVHDDNLFAFRAFMCAQRSGYLADTVYKRRIRPGSILTSGDRFLSAYSYFKIGCLLIKYDDLYSPQMSQEAKAWSAKRIRRVFQAAMKEYRLCTDEERKGREASSEYALFYQMIEGSAQLEQKNKEKEKAAIAKAERLQKDLKKIKNEHSKLKKEHARLAEENKRIKKGLPYRIWKLGVKIKNKLASVFKAAQHE